MEMTLDSRNALWFKLFLLSKKKRSYANDVAQPAQVSKFSKCPEQGLKTTIHGSKQGLEYKLS
jgi:hypothetical protein